MVTNFALENILNQTYLEPIILKIKAIIGKKAIKSAKRTCRKNVLFASKILLSGKGKKIKKFKSCSWCCIKDWQQFDILLLVRKWIPGTVS